MPAIHMTVEGKELSTLAVCIVVSADMLTPEGLLTPEQARQCFAAAKKVMPPFSSDLQLGYADVLAVVFEYMDENARPYCKEILMWDELPKPMAGTVLPLDDGRSIFRSRRFNRRGFATLDL